MSNNLVEVSLLTYIATRKSDLFVFNHPETNMLRFKTDRLAPVAIFQVIFLSNKHQSNIIMLMFTYLNYRKAILIEERITSAPEMIK